MTHICVMSSHKPISIYMGGLILGVNTLYRLFCFFKLFPMVGKGLINIFQDINLLKLRVLLKMDFFLVRNELIQYAIKFTKRTKTLKPLYS